MWGRLSILCHLLLVVFDVDVAVVAAVSVFVVDDDDDDDDDEDDDGDDDDDDDDDDGDVAQGSALLLDTTDCYYMTKCCLESFLR